MPKISSRLPAESLSRSIADCPETRWQNDVYWHDCSPALPERMRIEDPVPLISCLLNADGYFLNRPTKYISTDNTTLTRIDVASGK